MKSSAERRMSLCLKGSKEVLRRVENPGCKVVNKYHYHSLFLLGFLGCAFVNGPRIPGCFPNPRRAQLAQTPRQRLLHLLPARPQAACARTQRNLRRPSATDAHALPSPKKLGSLVVRLSPIKGYTSERASRTTSRLRDRKTLG